LLVVLAGGAVLFWAHGPDEVAVAGWSAEWRRAATEHRIEALAIFIAAEVALLALSAPVGFWLTVLAGFLFGMWPAVLVVSFASTAGGLLAFLASRFLFANALRRAAATRPRLGRWLAAIDRGVHRHGAFYLILLRLTPVVPFWAINLALGLTPMRPRTFWWASQVGMLPMTLVMANVGAGLAEIHTFGELLTPRLLGGLALMPVVPLVLDRAARMWLRRWNTPPVIESPEGTESASGGSPPVLPGNRTGESLS
jgi:uncharacterized membrane protein YdjX (TVP38/TMEM64 family)